METCHLLLSLVVVDKKNWKISPDAARWPKNKRSHDRTPTHVD